MQRNKKGRLSLRTSGSSQVQPQARGDFTASHLGAISYPAHSPGFSSACIFLQGMALPCVPCSLLVNEKQAQGLS